MRKPISLLLLCIFLATAVPVFAQELTPSDTIPVVIAPEIFERAGDALNSGDFEQAILDYSLFILLNPTFGGAYYLRGVSYGENGNLEEAMADLNQALAYATDANPVLTASVYSTRADMHLRQNDVESGLADLEQAITIQPEEAASYLMRAQVYQALSRHEEALADYNTYLEMVPNSVSAIIGRADIYLTLGQLDEALLDYDLLIELLPEAPDLYEGRAQIHLQKNNVPAALEDLDQAILLRPPSEIDSGLYLQRGSIHNFLDHQADGAADYARYINLVATRTIDLDQDLLTPSRPINVYLTEGVVYQVPITGLEGQIVSFGASAAEGETQPIDPLLVLLDPNGNAIASNDDRGNTFNAAILQFGLPTDGLYTLLVSHARGGSTGSIDVVMDISG